MKKATLAATAALIATFATAAEKGATVFSDDFASKLTLAEHWVVEGDVKSADGVLTLGKGAKVTCRAQLPEKYILSWKEGVDRTEKSRACTKAENPEVVFTADDTLILDDVEIAQVADANASPNLVINSGFEYTTDDVPLYYCNRSEFKWKDRSGEEYEQWLKCFRVDTAEKHSGEQSLKVSVRSFCDGFWFYPGRTATRKGATGVFSVWMKASRPGVKIDLEFGGAKSLTVALTTDWTRYELLSENMPAPGLFSPVGFRIRDCANNEGDIWIDDLQLEYGSASTAYRPSDLDKSRFGTEDHYERPASVQVPRLPDDVKPSVELEKWVGLAASAGHFRWKRQEPLQKTEGYLACDDDNLYIAYRNFGEDPKFLNHKHFHKDATEICMIDSTDVMFRTGEEKKDYHFFFAPNGDVTDVYADNLGWDSHATVKCREHNGAVEYFITIPFADLAPNGFTSHWAYNLGRNDRHSADVECPGTSFTRNGDFREDSTWMTLDLPAAVAKKWEGVAAARKSAAQPEVIGRLDYYITEPEARFRVYDEAGKVEEVAMDISGMACGTNAVTIRAHGRDWQTTVVKLPPKAGAVQRNFFARCLERNGEKILMVNHCFIVREVPAQEDGHFEPLSFLAKRGFKSVHLCSFNDRKIIDKTRAMAEQAKALGMDVLLWTEDKDGKEFSRADARKVLGDLDNVISRIVCDEPELHFTGEYVKNFINEEKKFFPYCPVQMNNTTFGFPSRFADLTSDVFMLDAYFTSAEFAKIEGALRSVDVMVKSDRSTPCWFFLTGVNTLHYKQPCYDEQVAQCWSTLCAGCSGLSWFVNLVSAEGNWKAMCDFNREAQQVKDYLLTEEITEPTRASVSSDRLRTRTSKKGDAWHVFTVSIDDAAMDKVILTLPSAAPQNGTAEVLFENRTVEIKDGRIIDDYAPFARHIYRLTKGLSVKVFEDQFKDSILFAQKWDFIGESAKNISFKTGSVRFPGNPADAIGLKGYSSADYTAEAEVVREGSSEPVMMTFTQKDGQIVVGGFDAPCEVRRVTVYAKAGPGVNLVANSGFEYDRNGVPPSFCNRSNFNAVKATAADYTEKYLTCFMVDRKESHSGRQSLRLKVGPYQRSMELFAWGAPTEKGAAGVLSVWAKASESGVDFKVRLGNSGKVVKLSTEWTRYEVTTTDLPAPGYFSPVWFEVPGVSKRTTEASVWIDDVMFERVEAPEGGFAADKTYSSAYVAKADDAAVFGNMPFPVRASRDARPLSAAENALHGYAVPAEGLIVGHYDFYMNEKTADFRVWDGKGGFEEVSLDITALPDGESDVTVKALGRDWKATVRKLPFKTDASQINLWSRSVFHDGRPVAMCAPCLIGADVGVREDGSVPMIDALAEAGFRYLHLENHPTVPNIEKNSKLIDYAARKGLKSVVWPLEGDLSEAGYIKGADGKASDYSRTQMYGLLDNENVLVQMVMDEPEYRKPEDVQAFMKREKARFPYKPVFMNNTWLGIDGRFAGLPTDILMLVYQLTCEGTTVDYVVSRVDVLKSIAPGKPCWYFLCSENSLHSHVPSYGEQFAQCWGTVAAGGSGVCWFVNMPTARCNFDAMKDFNREFQEQADFLCSDELCGGAVTGAAADEVRCLTRRHGDEWRIYTVNVTPRACAGLAIKLPSDIPQDAKIEVLYENRTLQAKNGAFVDDLAGYARHVYRIVK